MDEDEYDEEEDQLRDDDEAIITVIPALRRIFDRYKLFGKSEKGLELQMNQDMG